MIGIKEENKKRINIGILQILNRLESFLNEILLNFREVKAPQKLNSENSKMTFAEIMTREQCRRYRSLYTKANRGALSEEDRYELTSFPNDRFHELSHLNSERSVQNEYQHKNVVLIQERVPEKLKVHFQEAGIEEGTPYRVLDAMTSPGVSRGNFDSYGIHLRTGATALPWVKDISSILPVDKPEDNPHLFFVRKRRPEIALVLEVPTILFPGKVYIPRLAYAYFFDKQGDQK